jgi:hypothetical protein
LRNVSVEPSTSRTRLRERTHAVEPSRFGTALHSAAGS